MYKIGDFSRLSQISIRMLRFYDESNVLKPVYIDETSGYRYYDADQLLMTVTINFLRQNNFSTAEIKDIVTHLEDKEHLRNAIQQKQQELEVHSMQLQKKITNLKKAEMHLNKETMLMKYEIAVKEIPGALMMCKRDIIPSYDKEYLLWSGLHCEVEAHNWDIKYVEGAPTRAYFYDEGFKEGEVDVEICVPVEEKLSGSDHVIFREFPTKKCVCATFKGGYEHISEVHSAISSWIGEHQCTLDGANFTIYHVSPGMTNNPDEYVTEVCFPIQ